MAIRTWTAQVKEICVLKGISDSSNFQRLPLLQRRHLATLETRRDDWTPTLCQTPPESIMKEAIDSAENGPCSQEEKQVYTSSMVALESTPISPTRAAFSFYWQPLRDRFSQALTSDNGHEPPEGLSSWAKFRRFLAFLGPGAVISVAFVDPDNYQTAVSSGASFE